MKTQKIFSWLTPLIAVVTVWKLYIIQEKIEQIKDVIVTKDSSRLLLSHIEILNLEVKQILIGILILLFSSSIYNWIYFFRTGDPPRV